jgi:hypothetical protein
MAEQRPFIPGGLYLPSDIGSLLDYEWEHTPPRVVVALAARPAPRRAARRASVGRSSRRKPATLAGNSQDRRRARRALARKMNSAQQSMAEQSHGRLTLATQS